jgi:hypothetical protein
MDPPKKKRKVFGVTGCAGAVACDLSARPKNKVEAVVGGGEEVERISG